VFNPFVTHKGFNFLRGPEYLLGAWRLDYRMHNKLFVGDNAVAITGGRNIGDEYFQASIDREFGDFDLAVAGPMVRQLSQSFDTYWNDRFRCQSSRCRWESRRLSSSRTRARH
jgi:putative cardiolipin synthase